MQSSVFRCSMDFSRRRKLAETEFGGDGTWPRCVLRRCYPTILLADDGNVVGFQRQALYLALDAFHGLDCFLL